MNKRKYFTGKFFENEKGGLSSIISEIILGGLVLSLLITVFIPVFKNNRLIINMIAQKSSELESIKKTSLVPIDKSVVYGKDVISVIRYFSNDNNTSVSVSINGTSYTYLNETYNAEVYEINREEMFNSICTYFENKLILITYQNI